MCLYEVVHTIQKFQWKLLDLVFSHVKRLRAFSTAPLEGAGSTALMTNTSSGLEGAEASLDFCGCQSGNIGYLF